MILRMSVGVCCVGWFSTIVGFEKAKKTCEQICRLVMLDYNTQSFCRRTIYCCLDSPLYCTHAACNNIPHTCVRWCSTDENSVALGEM